MECVTYPDDVLPTGVVLLTEANGIALYELFDSMLDDDFPVAKAQAEFAKILDLDPKAVFEDQFPPYAMLAGAPLQDGQNMAQIWKHPRVDQICCRVVVYRDGEGEFSVHIRSDRQPFAMFYPGDERLQKGAAMVICKPETPQEKNLKLNDTGDDTVFTGMQPYSMKEALDLFGEAEAHARGQCNCGSKVSMPTFG